MITVDQLRRIHLGAKPSILHGIVDNQDVLAKYEITPGNRLQMFLAQIAHESDGFRTTREYASGTGYEGREDLGNVNEGDGRLFRGRGLIQLTGRFNYEKFGELLGLDLVGYPDQVEKFPTALTVSALYWYDRKLNAIADDGNFEKITRRINGGLNGYADRQRYLSIIQDGGIGE